MISVSVQTSGGRPDGRSVGAGDKGEAGRRDTTGDTGDSGATGAAGAGGGAGLAAGDGAGAGDEGGDNGESGGSEGRRATMWCGRGPALRFGGPERAASAPRLPPAPPPPLRTAPTGSKSASSTIIRCKGESNQYRHFYTYKFVYLKKTDLVYLERVAKHMLPDRLGLYLA